MAVTIKLNGIYIGATTMTTSEIINAENAGFTILRNGNERIYKSKLHRIEEEE